MEGMAGQKSSLTWVVNLAALLLVVMWTIPTAGLFVSSFRDRDQIATSGWWKSMSASEQTDFVRTGNADDQKQDGALYVLEGNVLTEGQKLVGWGTSSREPAAYKPGETADADGAKLTVNEDGSYRMESATPFEMKRGERIFVTTSSPPKFTLSNYTKVLTAEGIGRAFMNTMTVTIPATIIPILIAAFAAYALAWMEFPGRAQLTAAVVGLLVVPLQVALIPLLIIAALATVIASQAVISGVFSLTRQAVRLGYLSPMRIIHTSEMESGQIYIPFVNWMLYVAVVIVIVSFEHSSNLAAAYGIAVTGTMVLTSILSTTVARQNWHWNKYFVALILIAFLCVDIPLFTANLDKLLSGGWLPLSLGTVMFIVMTTWKSERFRLLRRMHEHGNSLEAMIASLEKSPPVRVPGTAVYMSRAINVIPFALMHNLKHNKVLHERVILLTLRTEDAPYVHNVRRVQIEQLSPTFWRVVASYGWRETPNVEEVFHRCGLEGLSCRMMETSFFMSHESLILGKRPWYLRLRGKLYLLLQRNALRAPDQFEIPPNRVIELGTQVEI